MKQLTQKLKIGNMQVLEVPVPSLKPGTVLVQNLYSLISAGTEGSIVRTARKGYISKAKERPQQVKQVIDTLKTQGPVQTYRAVMKKLDTHSSLGYSCVGEVVDVGPDISDFQIGDLVACGGLAASHAEVVAVPVNLVVKLRFSKEKGEDDPDRLLKAAAYNTLGAIAMQGVRQADLRLGESCAVIGLGLLGQLTCLLLKASGVKVLGIDIDANMVKIAKERCTDIALTRDDSGIEQKILEFTDGFGCDAVIITAATSSLDPINFAGAISRKKGNIVVVGDVPTGFDRNPHYYKKELQVKMSCSYGPGRYDPNYEEKGLDYPHAYVRWTEKRNMKAFQELIYLGKINIDYLTTHTFKLEDAPAAYDMIMERSEPFIGILIKYDPQITQITQKKIITSSPSATSHEPSAVTIGFIGAGSYAQSYLLPNIPKNKDVVLKGVMTSTGTSARSVAERFNFEFCTSEEKDIFENEDINTVFIATRHDSHAEYVLKALKTGKHVFVEKPLCLTEEELKEIKLATPDKWSTNLTGQADSPRRNRLRPDEIGATFHWASIPQGKHRQTQTDQHPVSSIQHPALVVGYNRRFAPLTKILKERMGSGPMSMMYRINAGAIPGDSWIQDMEIGGGRIIGEICHFVDYLTCINGSLPVSVYASAMNDAQGRNDTLTVSLKYENGSIGSIQYFANGPKSLFKEYIEIYAHGVTGIIKDFKELEIYGSKKPFKKKLMSQDKGQKEEVRSFIDSILKGAESIIPLEEIFNTSEVTFKIIESIRRHEVLLI